MVEAISYAKKTSSKVFDTPYAYFSFVTPDTYDHDAQLQSFKEFAKTKSSFSFFHEDLKDSNFSRVSNKLEPGRKYVVRIIEVQQKVTTTFCYSYLKKTKGLNFCRSTRSFIN